MNTLHFGRLIPPYIYPDTTAGWSKINPSNLIYLAMASYFDELDVEEDERPAARINRLTRETFRMIFDYDPLRYGEIVGDMQAPPPASKSEIDKLIVPSLDEILGKIVFYKKLHFV